MTEDEQVDASGLGRLVEHAIAGGVCGVLALGATGEAPALNERTRQQMIELSAEYTSGRVPVICGIIEAGTRNAIGSCRMAASAGAGAVLVPVPGYYSRSTKAIEAYYREIASASPIPVWLYDDPAHTHTSLPFELVCRLRECGNITALKDSTGNFTSFQQLLAAFRSDPGFALYQGIGHQLGASVLMGATGGIAGLASVVPAFFVSIYQAAREMQVERVMRLQSVLLEYRRIVATSPHLGIALTKSALEILGVCSARTAQPSESIDSELKDAMKRFVHRCMEPCDTTLTTN